MTVNQNQNSYVELLLGEPELRPLFSAAFHPESIDPLGYDLRLGDRVGHVNTGITDTPSSNEEEIEIFPGETIIVCTEEVLSLPNDVFGVGSPKMSLLIKGLWAHGGKTDFGFRQNLTLGFQNVGCEPIILHRGDKIFHLSFYRVHNKTPNAYSGRGPAWPTMRASPLDEDTNLNKERLNRIKEVDGIKTHRVSKQIFRLSKHIGWSYYIPVLAIVIIFTGQTFHWLNFLTPNQVQLLNAIVGILGVGIPIIREIFLRIVNK